MANKIVAGNWKMNKTRAEANELVTSLASASIRSDVQVILGIPFPFLLEAARATSNSDRVAIAAQNCHQEEKGAYTGEVSVSMISSVGATYVIVGHSERRTYFNESDELIKQKVDLLLANDLNVIYCCGESLTTRESDGHVDFVTNQLNTSLSHLSDDQFRNVIIAYEPIWAIGTGRTATPEQAQEMHHTIREWLRQNTGIADEVSLLYGGSCKPSNAKSLFDQKDVDGGLIGGASLKAADFLAIIDAHG